MRPTHPAYFNAHSEQGVLRVSIAVTLVMAVLGLIFILLTGSLTIIFDTVYELIDLVMTLLALLVVKLIMASTSHGVIHRKVAERFSMGFWHLEPMVLGLNAMLLMGASVYGLISAINSLLHGGRDVVFSYAIFYAVLSLIVELAGLIFVKRANRSIGSEFLVLDAKAYVISAAISAAYLIAFVGASMAQNTRYDWLTSYIDPAVLALVCAITLPMPLSTVRRSLADILLITPLELKQQVDEVGVAIVQRHGFISHKAYVARVGRGRQIELNFVVPAEAPARSLREWDRLRDEIGAALGEDTPNRSLSIIFTSDPEWVH